jgi:molybdopterin-containing oxidoreductase family iron-sulfur binding subunit
MSKRAPLLPNQRPEPGPPKHWVSLEHLADKPEVKALMEREFPEGADKIDAPTRRTFLTLMSASFAMMGLTGCIRRPEEHIIPYQKLPEGMTLGIPQHYATTVSHRGEGLGVLVECHEGRPTKIEGNPEHPASLGGTMPQTQAMILELYDPDRVQQPHKDGKPATYDQVVGELTSKLDAAAQNGGARLRVLMESTTSPSAARLKTAFLQRFPKAKIHTYDSASAANVRAGTKIAFGDSLRPVYQLDRARVVLAVDSDFLYGEPASVVNTKAWSRTRKIQKQGDRMSRLYVVEPALSVTGMNADHRLRVPAGSIEDFLGAVAAELVKRGAPLNALASKVKANAAYDAKFIGWAVDELMKARGSGIVMVGSRQPPSAHALGWAINDALGNLNRTVRFAKTDLDLSDPVADLKALTTDMSSGQVDTILVLNGIPAYSAPADLDFVTAYKKVATRFFLAAHHDETAEVSTHILPRAHELETWGDMRAPDGTTSLAQPLIAPIFDGKSELEILALAAKTPETRGHDIVRATFHANADVALLNAGLNARKDPSPVASAAAAGSAAPAGSGSAAAVPSAAPPSAPPVPAPLPEERADKTWRRALHDGLIRNTAGPFQDAKVDYEAVAREAGKRPAVSPTAGALEITFSADSALHDGRFANVSWMPELPNPITKTVWDNTAWISPATATALGVNSGDVVRISLGGKSVEIPVWVVPGTADFSVQLHLGWGRRMIGRIAEGHGFDVSPLRTTAGFWFAQGATVAKTGSDYQIAVTQEHNMLEGRPIVREATLEEFRKDGDFAEKQGIEHPPLLPLWDERKYEQHKWGMVIDLNACTGCNACVIACQAENNTPTVGKEQVTRQREMHWIRLDRYFSGTIDDPLVVNQPQMCQQCENAPCENVCPVNATSHSPEGLNEMTYNRCIGTRYCANNCPYKARRFNFLDYHEAVPETLKMVQNPNVSVRMRGVMEKCTYCVQRIQSAKIAAKRDGRVVTKDGKSFPLIKDGEIKSACEQACPADAIVFGDLNDPNSRVSRAAKSEIAYRVLEELNTKPRTSYISKIRNPHTESSLCRRPPSSRTSAKYR